MTFKDHFSAAAASYAAHRPTYPKALVDWLASVAPSRGRALDVGCGTGQLSVLLAEAFDEVVATDASEKQIDNATAHPRVRYAAAPCERSGLADASIDLLTVAQAAHWFDLPAFYAEARRVLKGGGVLALVTYGVFEGEPDVAQRLSRLYWDEIGPYWPPERRHVEAGYRTLDFPFAEIEAPPLAIEIAWNLADFVGYVDTWSAVREMEKAVGRGPLDAFATDIAALWGAAERTRLFRFPLSIRAARM